MPKPNPKDKPNKPPKDDGEKPGNGPVIKTNDKEIHIHVVVNVYNDKKKKKKRKAVGFAYTITDEKGDEVMTPVTLHVDKAVTVTIGSPIDAKGRPAKIDGNPSFETVDGGPVSLTPAADGMSCKIAGVNPTADGQVVQVIIKGDADLGAGVEEITELIEVTVLPAKAVGFTVTVSAEEDV